MNRNFNRLRESVRTISILMIIASLIMVAIPPINQVGSFESALSRAEAEFAEDQEKQKGFESLQQVLTIIGTLADIAITDLIIRNRILAGMVILLATLSLIYLGKKPTA